jgi:dihydrofolate reductase
MRKIVYGVGISLDGYIARPDGAVDFLFMPKDFSMAPFLASIDTAVMGRKTYDVAASAMGEASMPTYVFTRSLPSGERNGLRFTKQSPAALVRQLRKSRGKDIWLMGGGELARDFLKADLVDELYLGVVPVTIGAGLPAFPGGFPQRDFALLENKSYSKGLISLRYKRVKSRSRA